MRFLGHNGYLSMQFAEVIVADINSVDINITFVSVIKT